MLKSVLLTLMSAVTHSTGD